MKKLLPIFALLLSLSVTAQTDLFFSEYVEGSGNNKALEIYNPTSETIDLSSYIIVRFSNGEIYPANLNPKTTSGGYLQLVGNLEPGKCHVIVNGQTEDTDFSPACDPALQALATQLDGDYPAPTYLNGNDAIGLLKTDDGTTYAPVDIFGEIGLGSAISDAYGWSYIKDSVVTYKDGDDDVTATITNYIVQENADNGSSFGAFWMAWSKDHTLIRKPHITDGVTSNPSPFSISTEWDTLPAVNIGDTAWSYQDIWTNLGTHNFGTSISEKSVSTKQNVKIFPNPVLDNTFSISANNEAIVSVEVYSVIGRMIYSTYGNFSNSAKVNLINPAKGVYMIRIGLENNTSITEKIIIK